MTAAFTVVHNQDALSMIASNDYLQEYVSLRLAFVVVQHRDLTHIILGFDFLKNGVS